ncbi:TIGR04104 family putative zinc finger protein [Rossellomorea vietnamensis]|uniref:TIGR04104 family putative zinc finger protein n=1 Tax=Rossellomorea vietnamensis TaxID=218284 RepID=UPI0009ECC3C7
MFDIGGYALQKCNICKHQFQWKELLFSIWASYKPIECSQCGKRHTINFVSKFIVSFLIIIPAVVFGLLIAPSEGLSKPVTFGIIVMMAFVISLFLPLFVKYEYKQG